MFTCLGWQVTLCDPIWQVTLRSSVMGFQSMKSYTHLYLFYLLLCTGVVQALCESVQQTDVIETIQLVLSGADVSHAHVRCIYDRTNPARAKPRLHFYMLCIIVVVWGEVAIFQQIRYSSSKFFQSRGFSAANFALWTKILRHEETVSNSTDFACDICVKDRTVCTPRKSSVIRDPSRSTAQSTT